MKKVLSLILAVMLVLVAGNVSAVIMQSPDARLQTYTVEGADEVVTTITTDNRIVGWRIICDGAAGVAALYDTNSLGTTTEALMFDEKTLVSDGSDDDVWYPAPKNLTTGLTVIVGEATTTVVIFFE